MFKDMISIVYIMGTCVHMIRVLYCFE